MRFEHLTEKYLTTRSVHLSFFLSVITVIFNFFSSSFFVNDYIKREKNETHRFVTGLLNQWMCLRLKSLKMQEYRKLQRQILEMKVVITSVTASDMRRPIPQNYPVEDIHNDIDICNVSTFIIPACTCFLYAVIKTLNMMGIIQIICTHYSSIFFESLRFFQRWDLTIFLLQLLKSFQLLFVIYEAFKK